MSFPSVTTCSFLVHRKLTSVIFQEFMIRETQLTRSPNVRRWLGLGSQAALNSPAMCESVGQLPRAAHLQLQIAGEVGCPWANVRDHSLSATINFLIKHSLTQISQNTVWKPQVVKSKAKQSKTRTHTKTHNLFWGSF